MLKQILLVCGFALMQCSSAAAIECYTCKNTSSLPDCKTTITCPTDAVCASEYTTINGTRLYNLGCKDLLTCPLTPTVTNGPSSIIGRSATTPANCSECCHSNYCNRNTCQDPDPKCADDKSYDCTRFGAITNICADASHIKSYCRRFCGFCNTVDGGWSHWSQWSICSVTCGNGTRARSRTCSDPPPANGGTDCPGVTHEQELCSKDLCPVHGGWTTWNEWSACSASCDLGLQGRDKTCTNPRPDRNGDHCYGNPHEDRLCLPGACVVHGVWSDWSEWGACSTSCEVGLQGRDRTCSNPQPVRSGGHCSGNPHEDRLCFPGACTIHGVWSDWSEWGACSTSCDVGLQGRDRTCSNPQPVRSGGHCSGNPHEDRLCFPGACTNGSWSAWGPWGSCTKPCGGVKTRSRKCNNPAPSIAGQYCEGDSAMSDICENSTCQVHGGWSAWSSWGSCSVSCDFGFQRRDRACSNPYPSMTGDHCYGDSRDDRFCFPGACANGSWSSWGAWGSCTRSCGGGVTTRSRDCNSPAPSITGKDCDGDPMHSEYCNISPCHVTGFSVNTPKQSPTYRQLTFTSTVTNAESSFNTATGVFTCKTPGYYYFSTSLVKYFSYTSRAHCYIRNNGGNLALAYTDPGDSPHHENTAAVTSTYVHLATGDNVTLGDCTPIGSFTTGSYSSFTGFLVTPDAA